MTRSKIPTILAIFVLTISIFSISFIIKSVQSLKSKANVNNIPQEVKITNIKDNSFTVSWLTSMQTIGFVKYSSSQSSPTPNSQTHLVTITNLTPNTSYSFQINSGGDFFDNNGKIWTVVTKAGPGEVSAFAGGQILSPDNLPAKNVLVYVTAPTGDIFSALTSESGNWIMPLPNLPADTLLQILVENGNLIGSAKISIKGANPTPTIILGQSYDFRDQEEKGNSDAPQVPITLP